MSIPSTGDTPGIVARLNATWTGEGPITVVLANGLGTDQATWRHVVAALRSEARLLRFDYAGTPATADHTMQPELYGTLHAHADDVRALLEALDVHDAVFVGHSMSAMVGVLLAPVVPERIAHLVMVGGSPRYIDDEATGYQGGFSRGDVEGVIAAAAGDYQAWVAGFAPAVVGADATPEGVAEFAAYLRRMRPDLALQTLRAVFLSDFRALLPQIRLPVDVLQAAEDMAVPAGVGEYLAATLPDARLTVLPVRGHVPQLTSPATLVRALRAVLGRRPAVA